MPPKQAVTEAVNDTLKAIAASLLMEQVLAPRFEFKPKTPEHGRHPGFDYGEGGYDPEEVQRRLQPDERDSSRSRSRDSPSRRARRPRASASRT
jgi:hypothetical protein